jgi:hypothetical protein
LKTKLKGLHFADVAEIQEVVTDVLKKVQKDEFSAALQKLHDRTKSCIYGNGAYSQLKTGTCLPHVSSTFKNTSPKTFGPHCVHVENTCGAHPLYIERVKRVLSVLIW